MAASPRIVVVPGSARSGSYNAKLAALAVKVLAMTDVEVTRVSLADYPMPLYNGDLEAERGVPEAADRLAGLIESHHGVLLVSPEYNASVSPLMKNAIDWMSRVKREGGGSYPPFRNRVYALAAASQGAYSGIRGLMHLRQSLELGLGTLVIPEQCAVGRAGSAFDEDGGLKDERTAGMLERMLRRLVDESARYVV